MTTVHLLEDITNTYHRKTVDQIKNPSNTALSVTTSETSTSSFQKEETSEPYFHYTQDINFLEEELTKTQNSLLNTVTELTDDCNIITQLSVQYDQESREWSSLLQTLNAVESKFIEDADSTPKSSSENDSSWTVLSENEIAQVPQMPSLSVLPSVREFLERFMDTDVSVSSSSLYSAAQSRAESSAQMLIQRQQQMQERLMKMQAMEAEASVLKKKLIQQKNTLQTAADTLTQSLVYYRLRLGIRRTDLAHSSLHEENKKEEENNMSSSSADNSTHSIQANDAGC